MPRPRRTFTREFKVQAVKRVTEQGYSYAEAARHSASARTGSAPGRRSSTPSGAGPTPVAEPVTRATGRVETGI